MPPSGSMPLGKELLYVPYFKLTVSALSFADGCCRPNMLATGLQSAVVELLVLNADALFPAGTLVLLCRFFFSDSL